MSTSTNAPAASFDLLSQTARQRLKARIGDAGGNIAMVREEVAATLTALDQAAVAGAQSTNHQAERAFHIAQLTYLDHLEQNEQSSESAQQGGFWSRLRRSNSRT